jgi:hypothetical protein
MRYIKDTLTKPPKKRRTHIEQEYSENNGRQKTDDKTQNGDNYRIDYDTACLRGSEKRAVILKTNPGAAPDAAEEAVIFK